VGELIKKNKKPPFVKGKGEPLHMPLPHDSGLLLRERFLSKYTVIVIEVTESN